MAASKLIFLDGVLVELYRVSLGTRPGASKAGRYCVQK